MYIILWEMNREEVKYSLVKLHTLCLAAMENGITYLRNLFSHIRKRKDTHLPVLWNKNSKF